MQSLLQQLVSILFMTGLGLALFLFGMQQLETGIRTLGLDTFQRWLSRATDSALASVATGIGVTGILQSSSLVSLLVLAFASAEVLPLYNAIGILIGANLGTTLTGWLVTAIGFKLSLQSLAIPLMGVGAFGRLLTKRSARLGALGWLVFGVGMILFGLDIMRSTTEQLTNHLDIGALKGHSHVVYFVAGMAIAAAIQSSSATMMLTLMALNSDLIGLPAAAAIVIGADLGTTSTTVLASIGGSAIKRQLALAHFAFNVSVDLAAFFLLLPALPPAQALLAISDPLVMLVGFHSTFNLVGVLVFLPILRPFSHWVSRQFVDRDQPATRLLKQPIEVPEAAMVMMDKTLRAMAADFTLLTCDYLRLSRHTLRLTPSAKAQLEHASQASLTSEARYSQLKTGELALFNVTLKVARGTLRVEQQAALSHKAALARAFAYSAKTLKDIRADIAAMADSPQPDIATLLASHEKFVGSMLEGLWRANQDSQDSDAQSHLAALLSASEQHFEAAGRRVNQLVQNGVIDGEQLSTYLNINRDLHHAMGGLISLAFEGQLQVT